MDVRYALNPVGSLIGRYLLVIEDDKDSRDVLCAILDYEGAMVVGAGSAEEALTILRTVHPHVILTDIALPEHDGFWLLDQLRAAPRTRGIPVVAVTAIATREEILDAGFDAYMAKPIVPDSMADTVLAAFELRSQSGGDDDGFDARA